MPPVRQPFPRFIADAAREGRPYGRWEERLREEFAKACGPLADEAGSALDPMTVKWFPDRSWGGRVYVPASGRAAQAVKYEAGEEVLAEFYGWVSFAAGDDDSEPSDLRAKVDFTDVTAELDGEAIDQAPVSDGRFTIVAVDAVHGFGDDLYLEIKLWGRNVALVASESLYAADEGE